MSKNRIKRAMAEAAGWICALAVWLVVAAMECGALRPVAGAALGLGLELIGALALCKAGVVRLPEAGEDLSTAARSQRKRTPTANAAGPLARNLPFQGRQGREVTR